MASFILMTIYRANEKLKQFAVCIAKSRNAVHLSGLECKSQTSREYFRWNRCRYVSTISMGILDKLCRSTNRLSRQTGQVNWMLKTHASIVPFRYHLSMILKELSTITIAIAIANTNNGSSSIRTHSIGKRASVGIIYVTGIAAVIRTEVFFPIDDSFPSAGHRVNKCKPIEESIRWINSKLPIDSRMHMCFVDNN